MTPPHQASLLLLDPLFCQEEDHYWEDADLSQPELLLEQQELLYPFTLSQVAEGLVLEEVGEEEEVELSSLLSKEGEAHSRVNPGYPEADPFLSWARKEAVGWMARACARHGFAAQTAVLAVDYLDRFLSGSPGLMQQTDRHPWMAQLSAVACLSLAAKVEETRVPLLLDLQVEEETRYVFEAKTIQRMELLVLSTLGWKMNPVTPLSFTDFTVRRMGCNKSRNNNAGVNNYTHFPLLHWEFQRRCQSILLSLVTDSRWVQYLPSELAAATMLQAVGQLEPCNGPFTSSSALEFENQILALLNTTKEKVEGCFQFILESMGDGEVRSNKRKCPFYDYSPPSPNAVIGSTFSCDSSNDSWVVAGSSVSSTPEPLLKKTTQCSQQFRAMRCCMLCSLFQEANCLPSLLFLSSLGVLRPASGLEEKTHIGESRDGWQFTADGEGKGREESVTSTAAAADLPVRIK